MSASETSGGEGGGVLASLLAPLRLPERVLGGFDELIAALERINQDLGARLDRLHDVVAALESDESHLNRTADELGAKVGALHDVIAPLGDRLARIERTTIDLAGEVKAIHEALDGVKDDIQRTTGLRGDRGIMERARDTLTGGND